MGKQLISAILRLLLPYFLGLLLLFPAIHGYLYRSPAVLQTGAVTLAILLGFMITLFLIRGLLTSSLASMALFVLYIYSLGVRHYPENGILVAPALGLTPISIVFALVLGAIGGLTAAIATLSYSHLSSTITNWRVIESFVTRSGIVIGSAALLGTSVAPGSSVVIAGLWTLLASVMTMLVSWDKS